MSGYIGTKSVLLSTTAATVTGNATIGGNLTVDTNTLFVDSTNNRVGVGTGTPTTALDVAGTVTTGGLTVNGNAIATAGSLSNRNVIINGDFSISQRGDYSSSTSIASGAYSVDRWKANDPFDLQRFTDQVIDGTRTNYVKVLYNGSQSMGFMQLVEDKNYERLRGQTITISAYVRTNQALFGFRLYDGSQNYGPRFVADGNWNRATWTTTWSPTSPSYFQIMFDTYNNGAFPTIGTGDYMDIAMVQVEVGDTATPFEHRSYGQELALCQRYYLRWQPKVNSGSTSFPAIGFGYAANTNVGNYGISTPSTMRATPTISFGGTITGAHGGLSSTLSSLFAVYEAANNGFWIAAIFSTSPFTIGYGGLLYCQNSTANYLEADAEL